MGDGWAEATSVRRESVRAEPSEANQAAQEAAAFLEALKDLLDGGPDDVPHSEP